MKDCQLGNISPTMLAYMAGFFDAEGCVAVTRHNFVTKDRVKRSRYTLQCNVSQKSIGVIEMFHEYFGGGIYKTKDNIHRWYISSFDALKFLRQIEPYLIEKKEEAQIAINFQSRLTKGKRMNDRYHLMSDKEVDFRESQYLLLKKMKTKKLRQMPLVEIHPIEQIYAYLAGFFDGEGFVGIRSVKRKKGGSYYFLITTVTQSDKAHVILELFRYYFGGVIYKNRNRLVCSEWMVASRESKKLLEALSPYLRIKDEQAQLGIGFQGRMHVGKGNKSLTEKELAIREAQRIVLHNLKNNRIKEYKSFDNQEGI
jgi:hypothetical protein